MSVSYQISSADLTVTGINEPLHALFTISVAHGEFLLKASSLLIHRGEEACGGNKGALQVIINTTEQERPEINVSWTDPAEADEAVALKTKRIISAVIDRK